MMKSDTNKNFSEIMQSHCVTVNGGSGVLVNAMTQEFSYVLTARHAISVEVARNVVSDHNKTAIEVLGVMIFPGEGQQAALDCAILKVAYQADVSQRSWNATHLPPSANLTFVGLPGTERASTTPIKHWTGHSAGVVNQLITLALEGDPGKAVIQGMSGGGVYHIDNGYPYLVGVEFEMEASHLDNQYGRVYCHGLARYHELLNFHASAPMIPPHMECFSRIRDRIFEFNADDPDNVKLLKDALLGFSDALIASGMPPPYDIMKRYNVQLLLDAGDHSVLETRELWVAYLEFVVISAIMDETGIANSGYISGIDKKRRLLYTSDNTNWVRRLDEILRISRKLLDKDGTLVVASPQANAKPFPKGFMLESVISNIAIVPGQPFSIDEVESGIYTSYKLTHLEGLRNSCVIEKEEKYRVVAPGRNQLLELKKYLNEIIN
jgi:hypothetical protein